LLKLKFTISLEIWLCIHAEIYLFVYSPVCIVLSTKGFKNSSQKAVEKKEKKGRKPIPGTSRSPTPLAIPSASPRPTLFSLRAAQETTPMHGPEHGPTSSPHLAWQARSSSLLAASSRAPSSLSLTCGTRQAAPPSPSSRVPEKDFFPPTDSIPKSAG